MRVIGIDRSWVCECVSTWFLLKHLAGSRNMASWQSLWKVRSVYIQQSGAHTWWWGTCSCLATFQHYAFTDTLSVSSWGSWLLLAADRLLASSKHAHWRTQLDWRDHACDITWECTLIKMSAFVAISVFIVTVVFVVWLGRHIIIINILDGDVLCILQLNKSCQPAGQP